MQQESFCTALLRVLEPYDNQGAVRHLAYHVKGLNNADFRDIVHNSNLYSFFDTGSSAIEPVLSVMQKYVTGNDMPWLTHVCIKHMALRMQEEQGIARAEGITLRAINKMYDINQPIVLRHKYHDQLVQFCCMIFSDIRESIFPRDQRMDTALPAFRLRSLERIFKTIDNIFPDPLSFARVMLPAEERAACVKKTISSEEVKAPPAYADSAPSLEGERPSQWRQTPTGRILRLVQQ